MRHLKDHRKLGRTASHRKAMLRNMVTSLIQHERIETTIAKAIKRRLPWLTTTVSYTTRQERVGKKEDKTMVCVDDETFRDKVNRGEFLEWAVVHGGARYGTLVEEILPPIQSGKTVVREVDVQGLHSIRELIPEEHLKAIFLTVDGWETLKRRILRFSFMRR